MAIASRSKLHHGLTLPAALLATALLGFGVKAQMPAPPAARPTLANPASQNCIDKGGTLSIKKNAKGGEYAICTLPDQRQCEEWALMRGECPAGPNGSKTGQARAVAESNTIRAHFSCRSGKSIDATFVNGARSSVRLALSDGRKLSLPQARSASGARYANKDESVVFWNKGDTAFIEEAGKTTYDGCAAPKSKAR